MNKDQKNTEKTFVDSDRFVVLDRSKRIRGQTLLIVVLLLGGTMIAASAIAGYVMLISIRQSSDIKDSGKAIGAADAGIEWFLYCRYKNAGYPKPTFKPENGATVEITFSGANCQAAGITSAKSVGESNNIYRAFQISL